MASKKKTVEVINKEAVETKEVLPDTDTVESIKEVKESETISDETKESSVTEESTTEVTDSNEENTKVTQDNVEEYISAVENSPELESFESLEKEVSDSIVVTNGEGEVIHSHSDIKVNTLVKLKDDVKTTVTGTKIPSFAYGKTLKVFKVLDTRVVVSVGSVTKIAVKESDLILV